ncbi:arsenate reductase (glutaredoxin) [Litoribrevibacter euphylliae]|uniref:Arsenate reductase n=1 Tax=Litoribrevibacter euphylliae TaxID=1834034 RepID=A0ABV7HEJ2_9GAMM
MSSVTIYHNPRCSKSRQTLQLLEEQGITPEVRLYLQDAPSAQELQEVLHKLGISARELLRTKEQEYKDLELKDAAKSDDDIINAMISHPKLIERPIVIKGEQARIGRPPEQVLEIL